MNAVLIVIPILSILMFDLGLTLKFNDFRLLFQRPQAVWVALIRQIILLPAIAFALSIAFQLPPALFVGMILIACCPGGSSSNVFSKLAHGDVALSVSLTALSSLITLLTLPLIMNLATSLTDFSDNTTIQLPVKNLMIQNFLLMFLPILAGAALARWRPAMAIAIGRVLSRLSFPALMLLAGIFFVQHHNTIALHISSLGPCVLLLLLFCTGCGAFLSRAVSLPVGQRRTIIIEIGMQNAAQAIAIASSPFIFNNNIIAIPAIIYALLMNIILLIYVGTLLRRQTT